MRASGMTMTGWARIGRGLRTACKGVLVTVWLAE